MGYSPPALVPGTGMLTKNSMYNFDPHPDRALSIAPGKRVFTSMATMMGAAGRAGWRIRTAHPVQANMTRIHKRSFHLD
jgi:gamma-glutamyltranspeptidase